MTEQLSIKEVKSEIVKIVVEWYTQDQAVNYADIYTGIKKSRRHKELTNSEDIVKYVGNHIRFHTSVKYGPGFDVYGWIINDDYLNRVTEKTLRRLLRKLKYLDKYDTFQKRSDLAYDIYRSLHMSARFVRTRDFLKKYRPELVQCSLSEYYITRRPSINRDAHPEYGSLWSAVPVSELIQLQLSVADIVSDIEGRRHSHNGIMTEPDRLERLAKVIDARHIIELGSHSANTILGSINVMATILGINEEVAKIKTDDKSFPYTEMAISRAAIDKTRTWIKAIDDIHSTGFVTPYSLMYHRYRYFEMNTRPEFTARHGEKLLFPVETVAIIFHDLHYHIQEFHNLYGTHE